MHKKVSLLFCFLYFIFFIIFDHSWTILLLHDYYFYFINRFIFCFSIKFMISKNFKLMILENKCKPVYHHLPFHFSLSLLIRGVYRWSWIFDSTFQMFSQYSILRLVYFPPSTYSLFYSLFFLLIHLTRLFFCLLIFCLHPYVWHLFFNDLSRSSNEHVSIISSTERRYTAQLNPKEDEKERDCREFRIDRQHRSQIEF